VVVGEMELELVDDVVDDEVALLRAMVLDDWFVTGILITEAFKEVLVLIEDGMVFLSMDGAETWKLKECGGGGCVGNSS
jgi:hypothetical protein